MSGPRVVPDSPISEAEWQRHVIATAEDHGWKHCHTYRGKVGKGAWRTNTSVVGWPDLTLYRPGELIFVELKSDKGALSPEQNEVLADLAAAGQEVHVWAPRDYLIAMRRLSR